MKKKKKEKMLKEYIDYIPIDIYKSGLFVVAGVTDKEKIKKWLKQIKAHPVTSKSIIEELDRIIEGLAGDVNGLHMYVVDTGHKVIFLRTPKNSWDYWETLMHELHHMVYYETKASSLEKETEAQAYLFEYLFHTIRRKISGCED